MKKLLSVVIASLLVFTALPFAAAADEAELVPVSISAVPGKPLLEGVEGHIENLGEENECFVYDLYLAEPIITVEFENGETKEYEYGKENDENFVFYLDHKSLYEKWNVGKHTAIVRLDKTDISCEIEVEVVANPVESISVNMTGGNTITEYRLGYTNTADPAAPWYCYLISEILRALNPEITVYYKNGAPSKTFKYNDKSKIEQESGWCITDKDVPEQTSEKHWAAGDTVTFKLDYMGADCDITFTIEEFPVASVSARATKTIMEGQKGVKQDENGNEFEWYDPSYSEPTVTLELADGTVEEYTYDNFYRIYEKYETGIWFETKETAEKQWEPGLHMATCHFGDLFETNFSIEITESPVESIAVRPTEKLIENLDGTEIQLDQDSYFHYHILNTEPEYIIKLKNEEAPRVYSAWENYRIYEEFGSYFVIEDSQIVGETLENGTHTFKAKFMNLETDFVFEIGENPVDTFTVTLNDKLYFYNDGDYRLNNLDYTVTVKYKNAPTKQYNSWELYGETGYTLSVKPADEKPWDKAGKYTVNAEFMGKKASFEIELLKVPYTAVSLEEINNELIITLTKKDEEPERHTVLGMEIEGMGLGSRGGTVVTDIGELKNVTFYYKVDAPTEDGTGTGTEYFGEELYIAYMGLKSEPIEKSNWFETFISLGDFSRTFFSYQQGVNAFRGEVTADRIDSMLSVAMGMGIDAEIKEDDNGRYCVVSAAEAEQLLNKYFGEENVNVGVNYSKYYENGTVEIRNMAYGYNGFEMLVYNPDLDEWICRTENGTITKSVAKTHIRASFHGDANLDGSFDILDLIRIKKSAAQGKYDPFCDYDGDGWVDASDIAELRKMLFDTDSRISGDINGDWTIDSEDYRLLTNLIFANTDVKYAPYADLNGDGKIDGMDALKWNEIFRDIQRKENWLL